MKNVTLNRWLGILNEVEKAAEEKATTQKQPSSRQNEVEVDVTG